MKKNFYFILFFSFVSFAHANYPSAKIIINSNHYANTKTSHSHHFSHHDSSHTSRVGSSYSKPYHFKTYNTQDFRNHFDQRGYTEKEILNQRCLYMFDEFVKFAQTYSSYKCTIQQLHAELKNLNIVQKAYRIATGTYCRGLQKRIHFLYNQLSTLKNNVTTTPADTIPITKYHSLNKFLEQQNERKTLHSIYQKYTPSLSNAIAKRTNAYDQIAKTDEIIGYVSKSYNLNNNVKQLLHKYGHDTKRFMHCYGNQLDHTIHQESLDLLDRIDGISSNSLLYDHQEALVDFTVAMVDYNHEGLVDKATTVADFCWTLLDYGQAIAEGAALGMYSAVADIIHNPIQATISIVASKPLLAYQLSKVLYNVADIGVTALSNFDHAKDKWNKYAKPLNNIIDAINKKEITVRDALKGGTAFVVGLKAQSRLLGGLGKFCNTIKQKSINFAQNNSLFNPQEYCATPEGLLFRATVNSNKLKPNGQDAISNLKSKIETCTVWNYIKSTDSVYPGTKIPKSFEVTAGKQKYWVCPNATKHMREYIQDTNGTHKKMITHNMPINCQTLLTSFQSAVEQAVSQGIKYDTMIKIGCWEFRFGFPRKEGLLPSIYHANFKPQNW